MMTTDRDRIIEEAWEALPTPVLVVDSAGVTVLASAGARRFVSPGVSDAIIAEAARRVLRLALAGSASSERVDLFGPPAESWELQGRPLRRDDASVLGAVVMFTDISKSVRLDEVRRDFIANVSHELRTPVGAISLLAEAVQDADGPVDNHLIARIATESSRLVALVDDLLELSAAESEGRRIEPTRQTVASLLGACFARMVGSARSAAIDLRRIPGPSDALEVMVDELSIQSALDNLVDNAIKYSNPASPVVLDSDSAVEEGVRYAVLNVADHGVGIPRQELERIFERFYRVDAARSRITGGTGLGLSIVRHIVDRHKGMVKVSSLEGVGSTFSIWLPVATSSLSLVEPASGGAAAGAQDASPPTKGG